MRQITKILGIGAGVAAVSVLGAYAFAQQGPGHMGMGHGMMGGMGPGMMGHGGMAGNFGDPTARLAAIKTEIGIKPELAAEWDAYVKVVADTATAMRLHREHGGPEAVQKMEPKDRQAFIDSMQQARRDAQANVKAAAETLLAKLDDSQKDKARQSLPGLVAAGPGAGMHFGMMGGPGMGHGMGSHESK